MQLESELFDTYDNLQEKRLGHSWCTDFNMKQFFRIMYMLLAYVAKSAMNDHTKSFFVAENQCDY